MSSDSEFTLPQLLKALVEQGGSDLHLAVGSVPRFRVNGVLLPVEVDPLTPDFCQTLCFSVLDKENKNKFEAEGEVDLGFTLKGVSRFRANVFRQKGHVGGVFRLIPMEIKSLDELYIHGVSLSPDHAKEPQLACNHAAQTFRAFLVPVILAPMEDFVCMIVSEFFPQLEVRANRANRTPRDVCKFINGKTGYLFAGITGEQFALLMVYLETIPLDNIQQFLAGLRL